MRKISKIEVEFAEPVDVPESLYRRLHEIIAHLARSTEDADHVHWLAGAGAKPRWSKQDARTMRTSTDVDAETGEPTWDETIMHFHTASRERYAEEKERPCPRTHKISPSGHQEVLHCLLNVHGATDCEVEWLSEVYTVSNKEQGEEGWHAPIRRK